MMMRDQPSGAPAPAIVNTVQVTVGAPPVVVIGNAGPGLLARLLWVLCIGCWLGPLTAIFGWLFLALGITAPLGFALLARVPRAASLRPRSLGILASPGVVAVAPGRVRQRPWLLRLLWTLPVGLMLGFVWTCLGILFLLPIINIVAWPLGIAILDRVPAVTTLHRN